MSYVRNRVLLFGVFGFTFLTSPSFATLLDSVGAAQAPPSISFSATPDDIATGQASTLVWDTTNATSVTIDHGVGSQPLSGSISVQPSTTTTYTLTATGPGGTQSSEATVTVTNRPIITFLAHPTAIDAGSSTTLLWSVTNSVNVSIDNGVGTVQPNGSVAVSPTTTTTYTLTAIGFEGTSTAQVTVDVVEVPKILSFTATPSNISAGDSSTLSWSVTGVFFATIDPVGGVFAEGSLNVSPLKTTVYRLTA
ncbi:MAG TPA: hypothetical protein VII75_03265, partial [Thermoanaerobaculia bacterium]